MTESLSRNAYQILPETMSATRRSSRIAAVNVENDMAAVLPAQAPAISPAQLPAIAAQAPAILPAIAPAHRNPKDLEYVVQERDWFLHNTDYVRVASYILLKYRKTPRSDLDEKIRFLCMLNKVQRELGPKVKDHSVRKAMISRYSIAKFNPFKYKEKQEYWKEKIARLKEKRERKRREKAEKRALEQGSEEE